MNYIWQNYRIKLYLNATQQEQFLRISNAFRFCYNWGLNFCNAEYEAGRKHPSFVTMTGAFTEYRNNPEHQWLLEFNVATCRYALKNVRTAFEKFFTKKCRYPKFKKKRYAEKKFKVDGCKITFYNNGTYVHIPGLGRRMSDLVYCGNHSIPIRPDVEYHNVYIKFDGIDYWLSLSVKMRNPIDMDEFVLPGEPLGIDIGLRTAATLSNGMEFAGVNRYREHILDNRRRKIQSAITRDIERRKTIAARTKTKYEDIPKSKNQRKREIRYI